MTHHMTRNTKYQNSLVTLPHDASHDNFIHQHNRLLLSVSRGKQPYDHEDDIYVERQESDGRSTVLRSSHYFRPFFRVETLISGVEDFQIQGVYMFATKKFPKRIIDKRSNTPLNDTTNFHLALYSSHNRGPLTMAEFPHNYDHTVSNGAHLHCFNFHTTMIILLFKRQDCFPL